MPSAVRLTWLTLLLWLLARSGPAQEVGPEQQAVVGREAVIVKIVLGVGDHPVTRAEFARQALRQGLGSDNEGADGNDSLF